MTRDVHALLIAGDKLDRPGTPTAYAEDALKNIDRDLRTRFSSPKIQPLSRGTTVEDVNRAFYAMAPAAGDLVIVMFAGHGDEPNSTRPSQSWYLTEDQYFTDGDLADRLLELDPGIDAVVISDCCYGQGFFHVGVLMFPGKTLAQIERLLLRAQSRALARTLGQRWSREQRDSPMVCISAASKAGSVTGSNLPDLTAKTVDAAVQRESYSRLNARFTSYTPTGGTYFVDARPPARMGDIVLHT